jgi:RES domain-containing protein
MRVWRLTRAAHARDALSGRGAALAGGRWNSPGVRMVYASTHRSLALLEMLVHVQRDTAPGDLVFVEIDLPDRLVRSASSPPPGWDALPWSAAARDYGDRWVAGRNALAVVVPSIVVPAEGNVLINPLHLQAARLQAHPPEPVLLDQRLFA